MRRREGGTDTNNIGETLMIVRSIFVPNTKVKGHRAESTSNQVQTVFQRKRAARTNINESECNGGVDVAFDIRGDHNLNAYDDERGGY
jgi:hypothetical protein